MELYQKTERVARLRETYMSGPMMTDHSLSYNLCRRQRYLFVKAWLVSGEPNSLRRRSAAYASVLENMNPVILDGELIAGQPDFAPLCGAEAAEWSELSKYQDMIPRDGGRTDHKSLDFEKLLRVGVDGLLAEISGYRSALDTNRREDIDKLNFYICAERELRALLTLAEHYAERADEMSAKASGARRAELTELAAIFRLVPRNPARTFREALQAVHFCTFCLWGLYQCGHPDRYLLPYYERDIDGGIISKEQAQELIDCFCLMYSAYSNSSSSIGFMVGGRDADGRAVENELTWMFINSIPHTMTADPSIGLCVTSETSEELLNYSSELLVRGCSHPAIYNDEAITASLVRCGVPERDARSYIHSCCVEITIDKKTDAWTVSPYHNTLAYLLETLRENEDAASLDELLDAFGKKLRAKIIELNDRENMWQLERSHNANEPAIVSCLVDDCLARGKGIHDGGAVYNWTQPNFLGISNVVESLLTIEKLVFGGALTLRELNGVLADNFAGHEPLRRQILNRVAHFGVNDSFADSLYSRVAPLIVSCCKGIYNYRGDELMPAAFSYNEHIRYGGATGASPDGRLSGDPLCDGSGAVQGRASAGPTVMLNSVTAWDQSPFLGGIAMNLKLRKGGDVRRDALILSSLIKTYLSRGGLELQVNTLSSGELRDAMLRPENYGELLVRVGGYSDYFISLPKNLQYEIISRDENEL